MNNLADTVIDLFAFLVLSDVETGIGDDWALKQADDLLYRIENIFSDEERQALKEAAARSLADWLREPDEYGHTPRRLLTAGRRAFLEACAAGRFNGEPLEGDLVR